MFENTEATALVIQEEFMFENSFFYFARGPNFFNNSKNKISKTLSLVDVCQYDDCGLLAC